jgi:hypothetical protein
MNFPCRRVMPDDEVLPAPGIFPCRPFDKISLAAARRRTRGVCPHWANIRLKNTLKCFKKPYGYSGKMGGITP